MNEKSENPKEISVVEVDNEASFSSVSTISSSKEPSLLQEQPSASGSTILRLQLYYKSYLKWKQFSKQKYPEILQKTQE